MALFSLSLLLKELQHTRASLNEMMLDAISLAEGALDEESSSPEFVMAGETNLMGTYVPKNRYVQIGGGNIMWPQCWIVN